MEPRESRSPAPAFTANPMMRGFLAALFTAGMSMVVLMLLSVVTGPDLAYVFIAVLVVAFIGSQLQERMRANTQ